MTEKTFQCLRCKHRFSGQVDPKKTVERSCPRCASNSVWAEPQPPKPKTEPASR